MKVMSTTRNQLVANLVIWSLTAIMATVVFFATRSLLAAQPAVALSNVAVKPLASAMGFYGNSLNH